MFLLLSTPKTIGYQLGLQIHLRGKKNGEENMEIEKPRLAINPIFMAHTEPR